MKRGRQSGEQSNTNDGEAPKKHQRVREDQSSSSSRSKSSPPSSTKQQQHQHQHQHQPTTTTDPNTVGGGGGGGGEMKSLKIDDALAFLDQVKQKFADQPHVFEEFLTIMRNYKSQVIDTPGVVSRVSELFKDHHYLILGFNAFLPPGYRIRVSLPPSSSSASSGEEEHHHQHQHHQLHHHHHHQLQQQTMNKSSSSTTTSSSTDAQQQQALNSGGGGASGEEGTRIDFEQAVSYVTKIKNRFSDQPNTYKTFLNILYSYQKEQSTIRRVYEQVATLFHDHPDLLEEFVVFLPEKPDLFPPRTPTSSSSSMGTPIYGNAALTATGTATGATASSASSAASASSAGGKRSTRVRKPSTTHEQDFITSAASSASGKKKGGGAAAGISSGASGSGGAGAKSTGGKKGGAKSAVDQMHVGGAGGVGGVGGDHHDHDHMMDQSQDDYENRREYAQANVNKYGPSYRFLPKNIHQPKCSHRTDLCWQVLNDDLVSMAAGSEESSFHRKSICDEIVFQCEDDRTELDIVIEQNQSTIRYLEQEMKWMESDASHRFKLDSLRDIHRASIARVYGERANEVLEGMRKSPLAVIPVIIPRLKQKDEEWRVARTGLNKFWREIYDKNHQKSMEEQCAIFKQMDKKALNPKNIIHDINDRHMYHKELHMNMTDPLIHHVIFSLLESVGELSESDMEKVRVMWSQVMIPFLNLKVLPSGMMTMMNNRERDDTSSSVVPGANKQDSSTTTTATTSAADATSTTTTTDSAESSNSTASTPSVPAESLKNDLPLHHLSDMIRKREKDQQHQHELNGGPTFVPIVEKDLGQRVASHVLFGNTPMLLFFRYYIYAYERLSKAKELAIRQLKNVQRPINTGDIIKQHDSMMANLPIEEQQAIADQLLTAKSDENGNSNKDNSSKQSNDKTSSSSSASSVASTDYFRLFLRTLSNYFSDEIDTSTFEDECKKLLGHRSWIIFTFDKLFANMQKQLQNINNDDACTELMNAFRYEFSRVNKFMDNVYFVQAHKIVGNVPFYVMNFNVNKQRLSVDVVEAPEIDVEKVEAEERGLKYIQQFLSGSSTTATAPTATATAAATAATTTAGAATSSKKPTGLSPVFTQRSLRKAQAASARSPRPPPYIMNSLECKVCLGTLKFFYTEDTFDVMYRRKSSPVDDSTRSRSSRSSNKNKSQQFAKFLDEKLTTMAKSD